MRFITFLFVFCLSIFFTISCKKDKVPVPEPSPITYPNYGQLEVGNYWVYERYEVDTNGNETPLGIFDTCFVEKDTLIDDVKYYKYVRPPYLNMSTKSFIRDSLHYLVTSSGRIIFSSMVFNEVFRTFSTGEYDLEEWMADKDHTVSVPLGNYSTVNFQTVFYMNEPFQGAGDPRYMNKRYAKDVGIVTETLPFYLSNPNYVERRLVDYHISE